MPLIMNFSSPMTLEDLIDRYYGDGMTNLDHIFLFDETEKEWTVDEHTQKGDVVFFTCSPQSVDHMDRLLEEIKLFKGKVADYEQVAFFAKEQARNYRQFAGRFMAVARIASAPYNRESSGYGFAPWTTNWYAKISDFRLLPGQLTLSAVEEFISLSEKSSRTYLTQEEFDRLLPLVIDSLVFYTRKK